MNNKIDLSNINTKDAKTLKSGFKNVSLTFLKSTIVLNYNPIVKTTESLVRCTIARREIQRRGYELDISVINSNGQSTVRVLLKK